jgi:hypothetical protein
MNGTLNNLYPHQDRPALAFLSQLHPDRPFDNDPKIIVQRKPAKAADAERYPAHLSQAPKYQFERRSDLAVAGKSTVMVGHATIEGQGDEVVVPDQGYKSKSAYGVALGKALPIAAKLRDGGVDKDDEKSLDVPDLTSLNSSERREVLEQAFRPTLDDLDE